MLNSIESKEKAKGDADKVAIISAYRDKVRGARRKTARARLCDPCARSGGARRPPLRRAPPCHPPPFLCARVRPQVEKELEAICRELLRVLEAHLLPEDGTAEGQVFYWKMAGDYWRYLAEFASGDDRTAKAGEAKKKYEEATKVAAAKGLPPTNPIRLGLALNYSVRGRRGRRRARQRRRPRRPPTTAPVGGHPSLPPSQVFYYEILNMPPEACALAKTAFDDAISELDSLQEEQYKDATLIMQLIRDNLTLWTSDTQQEDEEDVEGKDGEHA